MSSESKAVAGSCLCGAVRLQTDMPPSNVGVCHCRMCQKSAGGPHMVWAFFPQGGVRFTFGSPHWRRSSAWAERGFCAACGSPMAFRDASGGISVPVGVLDHPEDWPPDLGHGGMESHVGWDAIVDDLPRFTTDEDPVLQRMKAAVSPSPDR